MPTIARVTVKGQTTIPLEIPAALQIKPGDLLLWETGEEVRTRATAGLRLLPFDFAPFDFAQGRQGRQGRRGKAGRGRASRGRTSRERIQHIVGSLNVHFRVSPATLDP
jgi:hypothetical protein